MSNKCVLGCLLVFWTLVQISYIVALVHYAVQSTQDDGQIPPFAVASLFTDYLNNFVFLLVFTIAWYVFVHVSIAKHREWEVVVAPPAPGEPDSDSEPEPESDSDEDEQGGGIMQIVVLLPEAA